jgi:hypothetical protein
VHRQIRRFLSGTSLSRFAFEVPSELDLLRR